MEIRIENLHKRFGEKVVYDGVSLTIPEGKITVILGGSGQGKSVMLKHIVGLLRPDKGRIFVGGTDLAEIKGAALDDLRAAGLVLACVANWDVSLHEHLDRLGLAWRFAAVLPSAEAGVEKPDPAIFHAALARLGVAAGRALHIGDEETDRAGAAAAGIAFEPVPLATLPERLGLR